MAALAYPPHIIAKQAGPAWVKEPSGHKAIAQNRIYNGEVMMKNPAGLPRRERFHRQGHADEQWWFRRHTHRKDDEAGTFYYKENTLEKKHFNRSAIGEDHSRRVFADMVKQRCHSEGSIVAIREDPELRQRMAKRYEEVMLRPAGPPGEPHLSMRDGQEHVTHRRVVPSASDAAGNSSSGRGNSEGAVRRSSVASKNPQPPSAGGLLSAPPAPPRGAPPHGSKVSMHSPRAADRRSHASACAPPGVGVAARSAGASRLSVSAPHGALSQLSAAAPLASFGSSCAAVALDCLGIPACGSGKALANLPRSTHLLDSREGGPRLRKSEALRQASQAPPRSRLQITTPPSDQGLHHEMSAGRAYHSARVCVVIRQNADAHAC